MKTTLKLQRNWKPTLMLALAIVTCATTAVRAETPWQEAEYRRDQERKARAYQDKLIEGCTKSSASRSDQYAAIAYSPATKNWGYSYQYPNLAAAQRAAVGECKTADAIPVGWASNGWYCALALGEDGSWSAASGATAAVAKAEALKECRKLTTTQCVVVECVCSR